MNYWQKLKEARKFENGKIKACKKLDPIHEPIIFAMMDMCPKLLLTGSTLLNLIGVLDREPNDIDFGLTSPLTDSEKELLINFFNLTINMGRSSEGEPNNHIDQFIIEISQPENLKSDHDDWGISDIRHIDIFKSEFVKGKDIVDVIYNEGTDDLRIIKCVHPSIPLSYKARYAFDPRVGANTKHQNDLEALSLNYFNIVKKKSHNF